MDVICWKFARVSALADGSKTIATAKFFRCIIGVCMKIVRRKEYQFASKQVVERRYQSATRIPIQSFVKLCPKPHSVELRGRVRNRGSVLILTKHSRF